MQWCPLLEYLKLSLAEQTQTLVFMSESSYFFPKQLSSHVILKKMKTLILCWLKSLKYIFTQLFFFLFLVFTDTSNI